MANPRRDEVRIQLRVWVWHILVLWRSSPGIHSCVVVSAWVTFRTSHRTTSRRAFGIQIRNENWVWERRKAVPLDTWNRRAAEIHIAGLAHVTIGQCDWTQSSKCPGETSYAIQRASDSSCRYHLVRCIVRTGNFWSEKIDFRNRWREVFKNKSGAFPFRLFIVDFNLPSRSAVNSRLENL